MMKNWMKITILLIVLVIFAGAFILLSGNKDKLGDNNTSPSPTSTSPEAEEEIDLVEFARDEITKIILKRGNEEITLTKEERDVESLEQGEDGTVKKITEKKKVWVNPDFDVDNGAVDQIALSADTVKTKRLIESDPKDLTIYGLDNSFVTTVATGEGKKVSLEIGDMTPKQDSYYAKVVGSTEVYTIDSYKGKVLRYGKLDIINKNLYGTEAVSLEDINSLTFSRSGEVVFSSKKNTSVSDWIITSPLPERGAELTELSKFLDWIHKFRVSEYIDENATDLKTYGLHNPKYVFDFDLGNKNYRLMLGDLKDSKYYGMMAGNPAVFTIGSDGLNFVDLPLIELVSPFVYIPAIYDVEKVVVEIDGRTDVLLINDEQGSETEPDFRINGRKMENDSEISLFRKYYQGLIGLVGDKIELNAVPEKEPFVRITYTMKNPSPEKTVIVELIPTTDDYGYYMVKDGQYTGMVMGKRKLDNPDMGIRQAYKNLMDGLEKKE